MKKNIRRVPDVIRNKVNAFANDDIIVCVELKIKADEISLPKYQNLNLSIGQDGELIFENEMVPSRDVGSFCRKNVDGYKIVYKDQEKVSKRFYLGERPYYGDWSKGSFSHYVTKWVFPSDNIPPRDYALNMELLDQNEIAGTIEYNLKVSICAVLERGSVSFEEELFFTLNMMQENVFNIDVFESDTNREAFLRTLVVNWEIFPPGTRDDDLQRIYTGVRNLTDQRRRNIQVRYDYLLGQNPISVIRGSSGMSGYFGAQFSDNLVVFENISYGNAIYVLFENWDQLSRLTRLEILNRDPDEFIRIIHTGNWQDQVERIIQNRR